MNPRRVSLRDFVPAGRSVRHLRAIDLPDDVVNVARPSRWGSPFKVGDPHHLYGYPIDRLIAVSLFRGWAEQKLAEDPGWLDELHGMRLACYDPADDGLPCHTDVLLELGA